MCRRYGRETCTVGPENSRLEPATPSCARCIGKPAPLRVGSSTRRPALFQGPLPVPTFLGLFSGDRAIRRRRRRTFPSRGTRACGWPALFAFSRLGANIACTPLASVLADRRAPALVLKEKKEQRKKHVYLAPSAPVHGLLIGRVCQPNAYEHEGRVPPVRPETRPGWRTSPSKNTVASAHGKCGLRVHRSGWITWLRRRGSTITRCINTCFSPGRLRSSQLPEGGGGRRARWRTSTGLPLPNVGSTWSAGGEHRLPGPAGKAARRPGFCPIPETEPRGREPYSARPTPPSHGRPHNVKTRGAVKAVAPSTLAPRQHNQKKTAPYPQTAPPASIPRRACSERSPETATSSSVREATCLSANACAPERPP